jgi:hypothetical protein
MKTTFRTLVAKLGIFVFGLLCVSAATAECGGYHKTSAVHSSWQSQNGQARLLTVQDTNVAPIVGLWHVKFITKDSPPVPDGTEIDAGYAQWHSDGTEIMNSGGRAPDTSSFCLGVWTEVGKYTYKLNHFAISWDPTGQSLIGPANIKEVVVLDDNNNHFSGTFTIDQYDESGNVKAHLQGVIVGDRVGVDTAPGSIF